MKATRSWLLVALLTAWSCLSFADLEEAEKAYEAKDYETAFKLYRPLAEQGEAEAQDQLGNMHFHGYGVPQDLKEALKWFRLAAEQGFARAQNNLGWMYHSSGWNYGSGRGFQDDKEAAKWYRLAAEQGYANAQSNLAGLYESGKGVPQDYIEALRWYRLAAEQGDAYGQYGLGWMYEAGHGVPQDYDEAVRRYRLAAEQGYAQAQYQLGEMYDDGLGVLEDNIQAYAWFNIAGANGLNDASEAKARLKLTPASIERAQALSRKLDARISKTQGAGETPDVQTVEPQTKHKTIYNACLLDKSSGIDMQVESLRRAVEETCKSIAQDPS